MKNYILSNNMPIPEIGFGTWKLPNDESTIEVVKNAIKVGNRHIDTASAYGNEVYVGKGIKESSINRKELFITGKLWNQDRGYNNIINACKKTIQNLDCDYLDLYLIHWPASMALYKNWSDINDETWKAFEYLYESGMVKSIGVCNFKIHHLEKLIQNAKILPMVNQIEIHPGFMQKDIIDFCTKSKIVVEAWSPLGSGKMLKKQELIDIANKYNVSVAQICIKWCIQNKVLPISKTKNIDRMKENLDINNFVISNEDMELLNSLPYLGGSGLDSDTLTLFN